MVFLKIKFLYIFIFLFYSFLSYPQGVATVENISGNAYYLNDNDRVNLEIYDEINLQQKIFLDKGSEATVTLGDGTTVIFFDEANFFFNAYSDLYSIKPFFEITVKTGGFTIETGEMPKISPDTCKIITPKGTLIINGTAINANFKGDQAEIFLMTDSLGNKGNLDLITDNGNKVPFEIDKGLELNGNSVQSKELSTEVQNKFENLKVAIVQTTIIDEEKMNTIYQEKLNSGKLNDVNGDGKVDSADIDALKKQLIGNKENKLDTIINNSDSSSDMLSKIIENSSDDSSSKILEKIIDTKPELTGSVVEKIIDSNSDKLNILMAKNENFAEKIIETVVKESSDANSIGKILANSNDDISVKILNQVIENKSELLTKVVESTSSNNSSKLNSILKENDELSIQLTNTIANNITNTSGGNEQLKDVLTNLDTKLSSQVLDIVAKEDSDLVINTVTSLIKENSQLIENKLAESVTNDNNIFSEVVIESAIKSGNTDVVNNASTKIINQSSTTINNDLTNNNQSQTPNEKNNNLAKLSQQIDKKTQEIKKVDPNLKIDKNILSKINEKLASPN